MLNSSNEVKMTLKFTLLLTEVDTQATVRGDLSVVLTEALHVGRTSLRTVGLTLSK